MANRQPWDVCVPPWRLATKNGTRTSKYTPRVTSKRWIFLSGVNGLQRQVKTFKIVQPHSKFSLGNWCSCGQTATNQWYSVWVARVERLLIYPARPSWFTWLRRAINMYSCPTPKNCSGRWMAISQMASRRDVWHRRRRVGQGWRPNNAGKHPLVLPISCTYLLYTI